MNESSEIIPRKLTRGEIYYIFPAPITGSEQKGGRPGIIVSNNICNATSTVVEVVYLTLRDKPSLPTHFTIDSGPCFNSTALCEQVHSISIDRIGEYMCRIPDHLEDILNTALAVSLDICPTKLKFPDPSEELVIAKEANEVIKQKNRELSDKCASLQTEYHRLQDVCEETQRKLDEAEALLASCKASIHSNNDKYKDMYFELLDHLIKRGAR